jgi:hypothetical protein
MAERTDPGSSAVSARAPDSGSTTRHLALYAVAWIAGALPLFAIITALWLAFPVFRSTGTITIGLFALAFPVVVRRLGVPRDGRFVPFLLGVGIVFGVISVFTGWGNGLTDEPFTTPRFVSLIWAHQDPYTVPLVFDYVQYGQTIHSYSIYPYLPLLMFLQIPGLDYKWFALACWVGMVLLVRKRFDAGVFLASPYVAVMAASGYNDFPVLLLLTVGFVGFWGRRQRWAELLSLGAKQFANVIVLAYYLVRRDWKNVVVTLGVSAAFILPFVVWSGPVVLCPAVLADRLSSCPSGGTAEYLLNYALWPIWVLAIFYPVVVRETRSSAEKGRLSRFLGRKLSVDDLLRIPSFTIVALSGAFGAVSVYLGGAYLAGGTSLEIPTAGSLVLALVGALALTGWIVACNRPSAGGGILGTWSRSRSAYLAAVLAIAVLGNVGVVGVGILLGGSALTAEFVGVFLATMWTSLACFRAPVR